jgi:hypothetical protein
MNHASLFALALMLASCAGVGDRGCSNPPEGGVKAFFANGEPSRDVVATVAAVTPLADLGGFRYDLGDGSRLTWIAKEAIPGLVVGRAYRFVIDYAGGSPDASGILVFERERLLFASLTDQQPFQHVLKEGIPGFAIVLGDAVCSSRGSTKCHEQLVNLQLSVTHGSERRVLHHGSRAEVGEFEVHVLTAQKVKYAPRCADAGLPGVSFTIRRLRGEGERD